MGFGLQRPSLFARIAADSFIDSSENPSIRVHLRNPRYPRAIAILLFQLVLKHFAELFHFGLNYVAAIALLRVLLVIVLVVVLGRVKRV